MRIAIMQPYFLPYIGYFQMIKAVDVFVFYDDVNYINRGWVNRNRILIGQEAKYLTIPLIEASQNKLINEICVHKESKELYKLFKTIEFTYKKAPYFYDIFSLFEQIIANPSSLIADWAMDSITLISEYLELNTQFLVSSKSFSESIVLERGKRLIDICQKLEAEEYINAIGGKELYHKEDFAKENISLQFIQSKPISYNQFGESFVPWLSILDVLMFNSPEEVNEMLNQFEVI